MKSENGENKKRRGIEEKHFKKMGMQDETKKKEICEIRLNKYISKME